MLNPRKYPLFILLAASSYAATAQTTDKSDTTRFKTVSAGPQYEKSGYYKWLWGRNYRKEWTTPVTFPVIYLDTLRGGLISYEDGGSNQSQSLKLKLGGGKEYTLRGVDKSLDKVIPKIFHGTFVADVVNDQISMSNPYGALGVPLMAKAAGVNHTNPEYYYLPAQAALDTLNEKYAGKVYLFEQRPKNDWSEADNLGNFKDFEDTDDVFKKIFKDADNMVDQKAFVRARLLDMMIGDFDRHADQWKWGERKEGDLNIYEPVPTDRDQAFSTHNGFLLNLVIRVSGMKFLQRYDHEIPNVKGLATINRLIDRIMTNKLTLIDWQVIAKDVQTLVTDSVIDASVRQMPAEIFAIRGETLISKLKARRNDLMEYATKYYGLLAEESEIVGTKDAEYFEVNQMPDENTEVKIFKLNKNREKSDSAFYSRLFRKGETDEIRLYGLSGNDKYHVTGELNREIGLRIIGGTEMDTVINETSSTRASRLHIYDDNDTYLSSKNNVKTHYSSDSAVHVYDYNTFLQDKKGLVPHFGYNDGDRFFVGARYQVLNHRWRKLPFAYRQSIDVDYAFLQGAFSTTYNGLFPSLFGKWDFVTRANYDWVKWINFYGLGNETANVTNARDFYRMRTEEGSANLAVQRLWKKNKMNIGGFYRQVKVINDTARFVSKTLGAFNDEVFNTDHFAGVSINYDFADVKDSILPQKGVTFALAARHTQDLDMSSKSFQSFSGNIQFFIPLVPTISLAIRTGGATIIGEPEFYQYPNIGQSFNLRGFRRERFSGKSTLYNNAELRFIKKVRSHLFNGKAGLLAFMDNGRVWMPGESSNKIHTSFGGGVLIAPFNLVSAAITYGVSEEIKMVQIRVGVLF